MKSQEFIISIPKMENKEYFSTLDDGVRLIFESVSKGYKEINGNKTDDVIADLKTLFEPKRRSMNLYRMKYGVAEDPERKTFCVFTERGNLPVQ